MKTSTTVWCTVLLACMLSRAAVALYAMDSRCWVECDLYGASQFCDCGDYVQPLRAPVYEALAKRGGVRLPFRFGKRGQAEKRQRLPFRYGKRAFPSSTGFPGYNSIRPSAYYPSLAEEA